MQTEGAGTMPASARIGARRRTSRLIAGTLIILSLAGSIFLPELVSLRWRLIHGNFARFHEWQVPVPWEWSSFTTEDSLLVQRMHRFGFHNAFSQVMVDHVVFPPNFKLEPEQWQRINIETQLKRGFRFVSSSRIRLDGKDGFCFAFATPQDAQRQLISCDFPDLSLSVGFIGDQAYASTLDSVIKHINRKS